VRGLGNDSTLHGLLAYLPAVAPAYIPVAMKYNTIDLSSDFDLERLRIIYLWM